MRVEASSTRSVPHLKKQLKRAEALLPCEETAERCWYEPGRGPSPEGNQADLGLSSLQKCGQQISIAISHPVIGFLLELPEQTKTIYIHETRTDCYL